MLARMEGPDWPRLDWPLSNADARHLGEAEDIIHSGIDALKHRLAPQVRLCWDLGINGKSMEHGEMMGVKVG